jgi:hypothetical protein
LGWAAPGGTGRVKSGESRIIGRGRVGSQGGGLNSGCSTLPAASVPTNAAAHLDYKAPTAGATDAASSPLAGG